jgi:hypothetical protein
MSDANSFDPWCERVLREGATHYQVLGLNRFEANQHRIRQATQAQYRNVWRHAKGPNAALAQRARVRIHQAAQCLSDATAKETYDRLLRQGLDPTKVPVNVSIAGVDVVSQRVEAADRELTRTLVMGSCAVVAVVALVIWLNAGRAPEVAERQEAAPSVLETPPLEPLPVPQAPEIPTTPVEPVTAAPPAAAPTTPVRKEVAPTAPAQQSGRKAASAAPKAHDLTSREPARPANEQPVQAPVAPPDATGGRPAAEEAPRPLLPNPVLPAAPSILKERISGLRSLALSPDGKRIACGGWDGSVAVFDLGSGAFVNRCEGAADSVYDVAWAPDGARIAAALADGTLLVWNVERGDPPQKLSGHVGPATRVAFTAQGRLISVGDDGALRGWNLETGAVEFQQKGDARWMALAVSASGEQMLTGGRDGSLVLWPGAGLPAAKFKGHHAAVHSVAFVPGTQTCVSASWDGTVRFWNLETLEETRTLSGPASGAVCLAMARDGARLAIGLEDGRVHIWDAKAGRLAETFAAHRQRVAAVVFTPESADVLSAGWDDAVVRSTIRPTR